MNGFLLPSLRPERHQSRRNLHVLHRSPARPSHFPPLLFIHGGYVDARCWDVHLLPHFAQHGFDCYALDLSGHGRSGGRESLHAFGLHDFVADTLACIGQLAAQPIVIGHSMGSVIAERVLEQSRACAAVLISPVPQNGVLQSASRLFLSHPLFLQAVADLAHGAFDPRILNILREIYFTERTPMPRLLDFSHLVQEESLHAITDLMLLPWRWPSPVPEQPVLVVSGEDDHVFPPYMAERVARRWRANLSFIPGAGHALIVDEQWPSCAATIIDWLLIHERHLGSVLRNASEGAGTPTNASSGRNESSLHG